MDKFHFDGLFLSKVYVVWAKKYRWVMVYDTEAIFQTLNSGLVVSKMAFGIEWTLIRALKSLKSCTWMGSFDQRHLIFLQESFRRVLCHDTKGWYKI